MLSLRVLALLPLVALTAAGCASSGAVPKPFPGAGESPGAAPAPVAVPPARSEETLEAAHRYAERIAETALSFRGVPYRNGGSDPSGFDCSGLVQYVFAQHGLALPREVREQFLFGEEVELSQVRPGDLVFFATMTDGPSHVGVAIGDGHFVHAPSSRGRVRVERYLGSYWATRIVGVRRITPP